MKRLEGETRIAYEARREAMNKATRRRLQSGHLAWDHRNGTARRGFDSQGNFCYVAETKADRKRGGVSPHIEWSKQQNAKQWDNT